MPLAGKLVCDVGAGTGVASRAALAAGADVIATDLASGMLRVDRPARPPAAVADATALPFPNHAFDGVVAAYCYNHLSDPVAGLREAARVTVPGGAVLASAYGEDDTHPVKDASERALRDVGWSPPPFYEGIKSDAVPKLATVPRAEAAAQRAGLDDVAVEALHVPFPELTIDDLIEWRLGMSHIAWFVVALAPDARAALVAAIRSQLPDPVPPLVRSVIHIRGTA